jgi:spermidine/putrescine transport system permease protein
MGMASGVVSKSLGTGGQGERILAWSLAAPALCCVAAFVLAPILSLGIYSFWGRLPTGAVDHVFTLANWRELFGDIFYATILAKTLRLAAVVTVICAIVGYGPAYYITLLPPPRRAILVALLFLPSWISYVVRSMSWLPILGKEGLINSVLAGSGLLAEPLPLLYNDFSVTVGMVQFLLPLMIVNIYIGLQAVDPKLVDAARTLGATGLQAFFAVTFRIAWPGLAAGCLLTFILAMGAYITPLILGGPGATFYANLVFETFLSHQDWPFGATLSLVIIFFLAAGLTGYARLAGLSTMFREVRR